MKKEKTFYIITGAAGIILLLLIISGPYLFSKISFGPEFNQTTGAIGDTIGGITAPFVNLLAALLVWISFREQVKANKLLSKETSYNFINSLIDNFQETFEKFKNDNIEKIRIVKQYDKNSYVISQLIKGNGYTNTSNYQDETEPYIKQIHSNINDLSIKTSGCVLFFSTLIDNIEESSLDKNLKKSFLIHITNEHNELKEILDHLKKSYNILQKIVPNYEYEIDIESIQSKIRRLEMFIGKYIVLKYSLD